MSNEGRDTTEFREAKSANWISVVAMVLGAIVAYAPKLLEMAPEDSKWAVIGGASVALCGVILKMLTSLGYIKSRTDVKVAEALKDTGKPK